MNESEACNTLLVRAFEAPLAAPWTETDRDWASREALRRRLTRDGVVLDREPQHLREARLAGAEEPGHPDGDAFVGLVRRLTVGLQDLRIELSNRLRHHVLIDLGADHVLVVLIDFDDLLDAPPNIVGKEGFDPL